MRVLAVVTAFATILAGCASVPEEPEVPEPVDETTGYVLDEVFDVVEMIDWWEHISTTYPKHDSFTPNNDAIRAHLVAELIAIGMDVEVREYQATSRGVVDPPVASPATAVEAIIATKPGNWSKMHPDEPDHRIGLVSHYDTQAATIHGAYDDKSGVAAEFSVCKALAGTELNKTLTCIFFDAEEQGLIASQKYVEDIQDETDQYVYDFVLGYDMTGINWPGHDWKMYVMTGGGDHVPLLKPLAEKVMHEDLGFPMDGVEVLDVHDRNSDERRFKEAGIPIYRFAGGRNAADYPEYHRPGDTVEYVYEYVGGRSNFEAGFSTIVEGSLALYMELDKTDIEHLATIYG